MEERELITQADQWISSMTDCVLLYLDSRSEREMLLLVPRSLLFLPLTFFFNSVSTSVEQKTTWKHKKVQGEKNGSVSTPHQETSVLHLSSLTVPQITF